MAACQLLTAIVWVENENVSRLGEPREELR